MLRWMIALLAALAIAQDALAADQSVARPRTQVSARKLPPGVPRAQTSYRQATVTAERDPDVLISSTYPTTPLLPGASTLPGYYGRAFSYYYQGAYYGGSSYVPYFFRLPYACGVIGYC